MDDKIYIYLHICSMNCIYVWIVKILIARIVGLMRPEVADTAG